MLTANKKNWFEKLFGIYNRNLLTRKFHSYNVKNLQALTNCNRNAPLIIYANHSSWWDGLILFDILRNKDFDSYVLMEEKQLKNLRFFQKLGAFSIVRENPKLALKSLNYAIEILSTGKNNTLLIFPEGAIFPNEKRPLEMFNGLSFIVSKLENCISIPCAIRLEFLQNFKPEIFLRFGAPKNHANNFPLERKSLTKRFESDLTENLDLLKFDIIKNKLDDFQKIF